MVTHPNHECQGILPPVPPQVGIWAVLHEIRSEYAQMMSCLFLLISGPGPWSLDAWLPSGDERNAERSAGSPFADPGTGTRDAA